jgi:hypothetical protein
LLLSALLPLSIGGFDLDPRSRAYDPHVDDPSHLAPHEQVVSNLNEIGYTTSGGRSELPWSDRAWDHNRALLNERYTDKNFTKLGSWLARRAYAERWSVKRALALPAGPERDAVISTLAPAEKYDLIMGTVEGGLADANRGLLDRNMDANGRFPTWWGICDGSAAASLASPEPVKRITVPSAAYGVDVTFYAPDVKALVSMLWSTYNRKLHLPEIGQQCEVTSNGGACADVNPASFHRAAHHFLGMGNGHLLMDTDTTRVVWNHPIHRYETYYYPPQNSPRDRVASFHEALLSVRDANDDPRRQRRAPGTAYLVGVVTKVYYGENQRNHPLEGSVKRTEKVMDLQYELELDENLNLLGGEWLSKRHPDLMWTIPRGSEPDTAGDLLLGNASWDGYSPITGWEDAARQSAKSVLPLRKVVEALVERSR